MKDRFQESGPLSQRIAPLDLLAWLRKGKLLQYTLEPNAATSGNHNYLRHCTCPSLNRKGKLLQCALEPNGPLGGNQKESKENMKIASPLDPGKKKGTLRVRISDLGR